VPNKGALQQYNWLRMLVNNKTRATTVNLHSREKPADSANAKYRQLARSSCRTEDPALAYM